MALKKRHDLNRREKLYAYIIGQTMFESTWHVDGDTIPRKLGYRNNYEEEKKNFHLANDVKEGDIVICSTSICRQSHIFLIGRLLKYNYSGNSLIEDVLTGELCDYGNESYTAIRNIPPWLLITDKQYLYWRKFNKACIKVDSYRFILYDCSFDDEKKMVIFTTREKWGDLGDKVPRKHELKYGLTEKLMREQLEKLLKESVKNG